MDDEPLLCCSLRRPYCCAQEPDPHEPQIIADGLNRSSVVVIGKFAVDWCWPWFDGWHCSGAVHVEESLYGDSEAELRTPISLDGSFWRSYM
jgi:hypothetical protein